MGAGGQEERPASAEISLNRRRTLNPPCLCVFLRRQQMTLFRQQSVPATTRTWRSATPDTQVGLVCQVVLALKTWSISPHLSLICYQGASSLSIMPHGSFKCNFKKPSEKLGELYIGVRSSQYKS